MITLSPLPLESPDWQRELAQAISDPAKLIALLNLDPQLLPGMHRACASFPLRVTRHYLSLIKPGDANDPLLRQILPNVAETLERAGYTSDPVGDTHAHRGPGILQKYAGRALLVTTGACAIHCRYCFRRHYPYAEDNALRHWPEMLACLATMHDVSEVILSGGDPLSLSDQRLHELVTALERMPHLRRLRLHTRLPVVLPSRLTPRLTELLGHSRLRCSMVLHINHPHEISPPLRSAVLPLRQAGVMLLNQSVLLAAINDDADVLATLSEGLFDAGILPYYLHLLDPVAGAAHFATGRDRACALHTALSVRLPGYLVPRLVVEQPGAPSKTSLIQASGRAD